MAAYTVKFRMFQNSDVGTINVLANNKADAYDKAVYEVIPVTEYCVPYSAWVYSVTYQNGNYKQFNTFEGKPY